jgi:hypothetical protein
MHAPCTFASGEQHSPFAPCMYVEGVLYVVVQMRQGEGLYPNTTIEWDYSSGPCAALVPQAVCILSASPTPCLLPPASCLLLCYFANQTQTSHYVKSQDHTGKYSRSHRRLCSCSSVFCIQCFGGWVGVVRFVSPLITRSQVRVPLCNRGVGVTIRVGHNGTHHHTTPHHYCTAHCVFVADRALCMRIASDTDITVAPDGTTAAQFASGDYETITVFGNNSLLTSSLF